MDVRIKTIAIEIMEGVIKPDNPERFLSAVAYKAIQRGYISSPRNPSPSAIVDIFSTNEKTELIEYYNSFQEDTYSPQLNIQKEPKTLDSVSLNQAIKFVLALFLIVFVTLTITTIVVPDYIIFGIIIAGVVIVVVLILIVLILTDTINFEDFMSGIKEMRSWLPFIRGKSDKDS